MMAGMSDLANLIGGLKGRDAAPRGTGEQRSAREVQIDAGGAGSSHSRQTEAAIKRLEKLLNQGQRPRQDAPRGSYLNITV